MSNDSSLTAVITNCL